VTLPILVGTDGHIRMSKSMGNAIGINEPADQMYGKVMSIPDSATLDYFRLVTRYTPVQIESVQAKLTGGAHPRDVKMELAREIVSVFHGTEAAQAAEAHFVAVFQQRDLPDDMPEYCLTGSPKIVDLLSEAGLVQTKSEGRRLIQQGGVKLDGKPVSDIEARVEVTGEAVLQIGRRKFIRLIGGRS
jgi:tyrosyl-tRNA synthetase